MPGHKILVVDDEPELLEMITYNLEKAGYSTVDAESGEEAVEMAVMENPELILLDMMLPGIDGIEVAEILKGKTATTNIPVIFLTAKGEMSDVIRGFKAGAADYVTKPFNLSELLARVGRHLEMKAARDELEESKRRLRDTNRTKDKFFNIISHEMINPISALCGISRYMVQNYHAFDDDKRIEMMQSILQASENGMNLLKNLLDWSRMQTGAMKCEPGPIRISEIAKRNILLMNTRADYKCIKISNDLDKDAIVCADLNMADMIIRNLMSNAVKFTPKGGLVRIRSKVSGNFLEIAVSDTGVGIKKNKIENLFKLEFRHTSSGTDKEQGTGLGLILCREFVEKNGGAIRIESRPGKGTDAIFTLPMTMDAWEDAVANDNTSGANFTNTRDLHPERIDKLTKRSNQDSF